MSGYSSLKCSFVVRIDTICTPTPTYAHTHACVHRHTHTYTHTHTHKHTRTTHVQHTYTPVIACVLCGCTCISAFVLLLGNTAPYHITQPSANNYEQIIPPTATMANITCALNITIPSIFMDSWTHNGDTFITPESPNEVIKNGPTVTLLLRNLQPSDLGAYKCEFINTRDRWILRRTITLG